MCQTQKEAGEEDDMTGSGEEAHVSHCHLLTLTTSSSQQAVAVERESASFSSVRWSVPHHWDRLGLVEGTAFSVQNFIKQDQ